MAGKAEDNNSASSLQYMYIPSLFDKEHMSYKLHFLTYHSNQSSGSFLNLKETNI